MEFGERLKALMNHHGDSQIDLARKLGHPRIDRISKWLRGNASPSFEAVVEIGNAYPRADLNWLVLERGEMLRGSNDIVPNDRTVNILLEDIQGLKDISVRFADIADRLTQEALNQVK